MLTSKNAAAFRSTEGERGTPARFEAELRATLDHKSRALQALRQTREELAELLEKARDAEAAQARRARQAAMAAEVGAAFAHGGSLREILSQSCASVVRHLDASFARVWTVDAAQQSLELQASAGKYTHIDGQHARVRVGMLKIGLVAAERRPHLTNDVVNDPRVSDVAWARREGMVAFAGYPLLIEQRLVGVFAMFARHALADDTLDSLAAVADMLAVGIERKRYELVAERQARRTAQLHAMTAALAAAQSPEDVARTVVTTVRDVVGASGALVCFPTDDDQIEVVAYGGAYDVVEQRGRLPLDAPLPIAEAVRTGRPVWFEGPTDGACKDGCDDAPSSHTRVYAAIPMKLHGRVLGGLALMLPQQSALAVADREMLESLAHQFAQVLSRAQLHEIEHKVREERERLLAELTETVRMNELFAGVLAHDLRTPLSTIMISAQHALEVGENERVIKPLTRVLSSGHRMARMIEQLLDFTRLRVGGGMRLEPRETDVAQVCRLILDELDGAHAGWRMRVETAGDTRGIWDADRLQQVFSNLIGNAVQHGEIDGGVSVRIDGTDPTIVEISVQNQGLIEDALLETLFDPFRGTRHRPGGKTRGLGLGLFITRAFVEAHGGTVNVTSSSSAGTTFVVRLPRRTETSTQRAGRNGDGTR